MVGNEMTWHDTRSRNCQVITLAGDDYKVMTLAAETIRWWMVGNDMTWHDTRSRNCQVMTLASDDYQVTIRWWHLQQKLSGDEWLEMTWHNMTLAAETVRWWHSQVMTIRWLSGDDTRSGDENWWMDGNEVLDCLIHQLATRDEKQCTDYWMILLD